MCLRLRHLLFALLGGAGDVLLRDLVRVELAYGSRVSLAGVLELLTSSHRRLGFRLLLCSVYSLAKRCDRSMRTARFKRLCWYIVVATRIYQSEIWIIAIQCPRGSISRAMLCFRSYFVSVDYGRRVVMP